MRPTITSSNTDVYEVIKPQKKSNILLISISTLSVIVILFMISIILCLILVLKQKMQKLPDTSENVYAELESGSVYEVTGENYANSFEDELLQLRDIPGTNGRISLSLSDGSNAADQPVYINAIDTG